MTENNGVVKRIIGPTILLGSGEYFDFETPELSAFNIFDIAHALSNICRYTGHCRQFYSVAQHSVLVSRIVPEHDALFGLLHDAPEAFIGDVSKPLKSLLPDYKVLEERIERAVFSRFGLPSAIPATVKHADRVLLRTEQRDLMNADTHVWGCTEGLMPLNDVIEPLYPMAAFSEFIVRFNELSKGIK